MEPNTAATLSALAAGVSALAAIGTAVVAGWSLAGSRRDSRDRSRPVLIAQLKKAPLSRGSVDLVVSNYGASSAQRVRVAFDPPIENPQDLAASDGRHWIGLRYAREFAQWPPGMVLSNVYRFGHEEVGPVDVTIRYFGQDGAHYADSFRLDPDIVMKETVAGPGSETSGDKRMYRALEVMARALDRRL